MQQLHGEKSRKFFQMIKSSVVALPCQVFVPSSDRIDQNFLQHLISFYHLFLQGQGHGSLASAAENSWLFTEYYKDINCKDGVFPCEILWNISYQI